MRELTRRVQTDACVDVDTNHYSVPWTLIGARVSVVVSNGAVRVHHAGAEVACHQQRRGRRERAIDRAHLHGVLAPVPGAPAQSSPAPAMLDAARREAAGSGITRRHACVLRRRITRRSASSSCLAPSRGCTGSRADRVGGNDAGRDGCRRSQ